MPAKQSGIAAILILLITITILLFSASFFYTTYFKDRKPIQEETLEEKLETSTEEPTSNYEPVLTDEPSSDNIVNIRNAITRNAKRQMDLQTLTTAIKLALVDGEIKLISTKGCNNCTSNTNSTDLAGYGWVKFLKINGKTGLQKYIPALPKDPFNINAYVYEYASDGLYFEINAVLEPGSERIMLNDGGNNTNKLEYGTRLTLLK